MKKDWKLIKKEGKDYYRIKTLGLVRDLPLLQVAPKVKIAILNILGDTEFTKKVASALAKKLPKADVLVTAEVKSVPLAYEIARKLKKPYVVVRKILKPYMFRSIKSRVTTITTGKPQDLWLDGKDLAVIKGKKVILVDDIISTGATLNGMRRLIKKAGGKIIAEAAIFTEGKPKQWKNIISLGNLPIF